MLWRLHAQRLLVERGKLDVVPQLVALTRGSARSTPIGTNGAAFHALWTLHGLGAITSTTSEAGRAAVQALAASGRRRAQGGGDGAAATPERPKRPRPRSSARKVLADTDLHTRLAVFLRLAELPASDAAGKALYTASLDPTNFGDRWLSRAIYIAAARHKTPFLTSYQADPSKLAGRRPADRAAARARQARLAPAGRRGAGVGLEGDRGAGELGIPRPHRVRRRRVVHAPDRLAGRSARAGDASASAASATSARCGSTGPASPRPRSTRRPAAARRSSRCRTAC